VFYAKQKQNSSTEMHQNAGYIDDNEQINIRMGNDGGRSGGQHGYGGHDNGQQARGGGGVGGGGGGSRGVGGSGEGTLRGGEDSFDETGHLSPEGHH